MRFINKFSRNAALGLSFLALSACESESIANPENTSDEPLAGVSIVVDEAAGEFADILVGGEIYAGNETDPDMSFQDESVQDLDAGQPNIDPIIDDFQDSQNYDDPEIDNLGGIENSDNDNMTPIVDNVTENDYFVDNCINSEELYCVKEIACEENPDNFAAALMVDTICLRIFVNQRVSVTFDYKINGYFQKQHNSFVTFDGSIIDSQQSNLLGGVLISSNNFLVDFVPGEHSLKLSYQTQGSLNENLPIFSADSSSAILRVADRIFYNEIIHSFMDNLAFVQIVNHSYGNKLIRISNGLNSSTNHHMLLRLEVSRSFDFEYSMVDDSINNSHSVRLLAGLNEILIPVFDFGQTDRFSFLVRDNISKVEINPTDGYIAIDNISEESFNTFTNEITTIYSEDE